MNCPCWHLIVITFLLSFGHPPQTMAEQAVSITQIAERIESISFRSRVLDQEKRFCVVLPEVDRQNRCDGRVLFLLHGRGRTERSLADDAKSRAVLLTARFAIVLPDGDDGWYIDSPVRKRDRYESSLEEVIAVATDHYHLSRRRTARGLSGWSMGGYGCVRFAETHADEFAAVAPMIGLLDFPSRGLPEGQSYAVPLERFGRDGGVWRRFNPVTQAERLRKTSILIVTADRAFDRTMNDNFARRLKTLDIPYERKILAGQHTLGTVRKALPLVIDFMERTLVADPQ